MMTRTLLQLEGVGEKENSSVKKGLLWQQRDRLFSRWKERYFVLTRDYLICFQRATKGIASSEMGSFIFKVSLAEVDAIERVEKKGSSAIAISLPREGRLFLRSKTGLDDWLKALRETVSESKGRREALRHTLTRDFHLQILDGNHFRSKLPLHQTMSDCHQESARMNRSLAHELNGSLLRMTDDHQPTPHLSKKNNRLSLMTDVDLNFDLETPPSTPSFQWSSSRTPMSTPRGSLCHSRPPSRMGDDPSPTPDLVVTTNGHSCRSEPPHRRLAAAFPAGDRPRLTNGFVPDQRVVPANSFKGGAKGSNGSSRIEHHRNMSGDLTSSKRHPCCNGTSNSDDRNRNRRFSLANATELIHDVLWHNNNNNSAVKQSPGGSSGRSSQTSCSNSSQISQIVNGHTVWPGKGPKTNGLILRVASERNPMGRQMHHDIAFRERSISDIRRPDSYKRWGSQKDMFLEEPFNQILPQQQMNIYTRL